MSSMNFIPRKNGLSELTNHFIYKDSKNFIWISSLDGLNRFDGRRIKVYRHIDLDTSSLLDNNIQSPFFEDDNHDIWFTTLNAIHCYRHHGDKFDRYFIKHEGRIFNNVEYSALFLEQKRWLWVRAGDSLFRYDTKYVQNNITTQTNFLHPLRAIRFDVDTLLNGQVKRVVACYWAYEKGLEIIDYDKNYQIKNRQRYFTTNNDFNQPVQTIKKAIIENDTLIWLAGGNLIAFNPKTPWVNLFSSVLSNKAQVQNIGKLRNNQILVSTIDANLFIFDKNINKLTPTLLDTKVHETVNTKLPSMVGNIYTDESNFVWLSTNNKGVSFVPLNTYNFRPLISKVNTEFNVIHIMEDKRGEFWINYDANRSGFYHFHSNLNLINKENLLAKTRFYETKKGEIYFITRNFNILSNLIDKKQIYKLDSTLFHNAIAFDKSSLLLCSNKGLFEFDTQTKNFKHITGSNFFATFLYQDTGGRLWVSTSDGLVRCYTLENYVLSKPLLEIPNLGVINFFHPSSNDPSVLWAATAKGILKIDLKTLNHTLLTETNGLPANYIQSVLEDKKGNLWCGTNQGIIKYNPKTQTALTFTKQHGLSSDVYNRGVALLSRKGEMWFGGTNGVDVFHPDSIRDIGHAPQSAIVGLKIFDNYWKGDTTIEVAKHITLKHDKNTLTLELAAMEYTDPENNQFKVALVSQSDTIRWTNLGTQNYVTYPNLREGTYTFMLLTANSEGVWNDTPKTLTIEIQPPYWRTWWFYSLMTLLVCSVFYALYTFRLRQVIKMERLRYRISADLHDDIGATLSNVNILTTLVRQRLPNDVDVFPLLARIEEEISTSSESLDDIIWSVNPKNDSMERVLSRMRQYANEVFDAKGIEGTLDFDKHLSNLSLPMDKRRDFYLIFKEALNNLSKYAQCTAATISLTETDGKLKLVISDNGVGFDPLSKKEGNGQKTMRQRAERLKADLVIDSAVGKGTRVELSLLFA